MLKKLFISALVFLASIHLFAGESDFVSSSSYEQSDYFDLYSSSVNVIKAYRKDAFDAAWGTGTKSLKEYCSNREMGLDESTIKITYQECDLNGPSGSLRAYFGCRLDLEASCSH